MNNKHLPELDLNKLIVLITGLLLAGLPHWQRLPIWIPVLHTLLLVLRVYIPFRYAGFWRQASSLIGFSRLVIMLLGILGVYASYGSLAGRDVGIALLVMLAGLKVFESKTKRDFYISAYLGYFLVITNFFYSQTIPTAAYMLLVIIIMTASLVRFNDVDESMPIVEQFRYSSTLILQSLPILLVLFILFPRVNGPLWGLPEDAYTGITGIDDQMTPGTISKLVQSNEVAFRVSFDNDIPERSQLYWRGPVLWKTDGRKWTMGKSADRQRPEPVRLSGNVIKYDVTIEPTNKHWLFGLEMVSAPPEKTHFTQDRQLKTDEAIRSRKAFTLLSNTSYLLGADSFDDIQRALVLPDLYHERTRKFAAEFLQQYQEPELRIKAVLDWFNKENFIYTLRPPLIAGDMVDEFLFNSRQGFCEHYAAAFTVLMRAMGIPARVVTGYQGGEINPIGNYLIVRQHDAHAWSEVWLNDKGWVRIDPTSAVSPERVNQGIENSIPDLIIDMPLDLEHNAYVARLWQQFRNTVDMVNYQWAQWVLGYGPERQLLLLHRLGFGFIDWKKMTIAMIIFIGIVFLSIAIFVFTRPPKTVDLAKQYYDIFCKKMAKIGIQKMIHEGPIDFSKRICHSRKD
ncbi:MAG: DUF3488 and transglutaminase-like domain-containing protein, partial [Proteobacteria bacterium]|nr:DUF3488 and transglutaminase-like domain-containing protein [Pseudomonadota bacterium]